VRRPSVARRRDGALRAASPSGTAWWRRDRWGLLYLNGYLRQLTRKHRNASDLTIMHRCRQFPRLIRIRYQAALPPHLQANSK
jgi:hypothetical protein